MSFHEVGSELDEPASDSAELEEQDYEAIAAEWEKVRKAEEEQEKTNIHSKMYNDAVKKEEEERKDALAWIKELEREFKLDTFACFKGLSGEIDYQLIRVAEIQKYFVNPLFYNRAEKIKKYLEDSLHTWKEFLKEGELSRFTVERNSLQGMDLEQALLSAYEEAYSNIEPNCLLEAFKESLDQEQAWICLLDKSLDDSIEEIDELELLQDDIKAAFLFEEEALLREEAERETIAAEEEERRQEEIFVRWQNRNCEQEEKLRQKHRLSSYKAVTPWEGKHLR